MLRDAPPFSAIAGRVLSLLEGAVLVAHGGKLDMRFLAAELGRLGQRWACDRYLDTLHLARHVYDVPSHRLEALCEHLDTEHKPTHRAVADAWATRDLFSKLLAACSLATCDALWRFQRGQGPVRREIFERAEVAFRSGAPVSLRYRTAKRGKRCVQFVVTGVQRELDPPLVLGYLHDSRGALKIRADRILAIEPIGDA